MTTATAPAACSYEVDRSRRLIALDAAWTDFALANGAPELAAPRPLGTSLYSHISDATTKQVYEQIFTRVTLTGQPATVPFRCDSPSLRRQLELHITPLAHGGFRLHSTVVHEEPRAEVVLLDGQAEHLADWFIRMCSWCKRVGHKGHWVEAEEAVAALHLFDGSVVPGITHVICPSCEAIVTAGLG